MARNEAPPSRRGDRVNAVSCRFVAAVLIMCVLMIMYLMTSFKSSDLYSERVTYVLGIDPQGADSNLSTGNMKEVEQIPKTAANNSVFGDFAVQLRGLNTSAANPPINALEESNQEGQEAGNSTEVALVSDGGEHTMLSEFSVQEYYRMQCLRTVRNKLRDSLRPYIKHYPGGVALIDVTLHTNLGDNVLWRGAVSILADFGISPKVVCTISQPSWVDRIDHIIPKCVLETVVEAVKNKGLVLLQAGGNWGDLYPFVQVARMKWFKDLGPLALKYGFKIIQLPVSIYYTSPDSSQLASDIDILKGIEPKVFVLFVRSQSSFEIAKQHYKAIEVKSVPDLAFAIGPLIPKSQPIVDVLIQTRQDAEKQEGDSNIWNWVEAKFKRANLTFHVQDWWYHPKEHPREVSKPAMTVLSEVRTFAATEVVSKGKVVVTNRLHGSIVSTLVGKHLFYVDTKEGKVGFVRSNALSGIDACAPENIHEHRADSLEAAVDAAIDLIHQHGDDFVYN